MMRRSLILTVCSTVLSGCLGLENPELVEWRSEVHADELEAGVEELDEQDDDELDEEDREDVDEPLVAIDQDANDQARDLATEIPKGSSADADDGALPEKGSVPLDELEGKDLVDPDVTVRSWGNGSAIRPPGTVISGDNSNTDCMKSPNCVPRD
jgi:hypothetical protein